MAKSIHRGEYGIIRDLLREKRIARGMTQVEVSRQMGRSQSFISDVERGARRVDVLELRDMCNLFGVPLTRFCKEFERRAGAMGPAGSPPAKSRGRQSVASSRKRRLAVGQGSPRK